MVVFVVERVGFAGFIVFCFDLVVACCLCVFLWGVVCLVGCGEQCVCGLALLVYLSLFCLRFMFVVVDCR